MFVTLETRGIPILKHSESFKSGNIIYLPFKVKNKDTQIYELTTTNGQFVVYPQTDKIFIDQEVYLAESQSASGLIPFQIIKELEIDSSSKKSYSGIVNWCEPANQEGPYFHGENLNIVIDVNMELLCLDVDNISFWDLNPQNSLGKFLSQVEIKNLTNILNTIPPKKFIFENFWTNSHLSLKYPFLGWNESVFYYEISEERMKYEVGSSPYQIIDFEISDNKFGPDLKKKLEVCIKTILRNKTIANFQWRVGYGQRTELVIQLR